MKVGELRKALSPELRHDVPRLWFGWLEEVRSGERSSNTSKLEVGEDAGKSLRDLTELVRITETIHREDAERFIEEVRRDDRRLAKPLRIEEREFEAGGPN
jgi:hypothetical protein